VFVPAWDGQVCSLGWGLIGVVEEDLGIELTNEQATRLVLLYELDPKSGRRLVRRAGLRRPKGSGKSPEGAYTGYLELVGDVVFSHWSKGGQPVGRRRGVTRRLEDPEPWVQFAAVSEDQTDNVMVWLFETLADRADVRARRGIDLGRSRIYLNGQAGRIEPVTAAAGSREGQRVTFAVLDQTESWTKENGGRRLADVLRRNTGKMGGWSYELQNAPVPGDRSVADETGEASKKGAAGVLFDTREPPWVEDLTDRPALLDALAVAYGEAVKWVDLERLADEIMDPATDEADARRYYLNQSVRLTDQWMDPKHWERRRAKPGVAVERRDRITIGFHGTQSRVAASLQGCRVSDGHLFRIGIWEKPATSSWEVERIEVDAALAAAMQRYEVVRAYVDPANWQDDLLRWKQEWGDDRILAWWTNRPTAMARALERLHTAVVTKDGIVSHDADPDVTAHLSNARGYLSRSGTLIRQPVAGGPRQIVAATACALAFEARADVLAAGDQNKPPPATAPSAPPAGPRNEIFRPSGRLRI
jgi:hypothetical protein